MAGLISGNTTYSYIYVRNLTNYQFTISYPTSSYWSVSVCSYDYVGGLTGSSNYS